MGCIIGQNSELVCGLPYCATDRKQTKFSIGFRVSATALGTIAIVIGALALCHIQGLSYLEIPISATTIAIGGVLWIIALTLKCVPKASAMHLHEDQVEPVKTTSSINSVIGASNIPQSIKETSRQELEDGITISEDIMQQLQQLMPQLHSDSKNHAEIIWHGGNNLIFSLKQAPGLIFKMSKQGKVGSKWPNQRTEERFEKMVEALSICKVKQLDRLVIPHAKLIEVQGEKIIVEQQLDFQAHQYAQEKLYHDLAEELDEVLVQLTVFIYLTCFDDVESRNIPLITNGAVKQVALIDLETLFEEEDGAKTGIIGGWPRRTGLINYLFSERQIDLVLGKACELKVLSRQEAKEAKSFRMNWLQSYEALHQFHASKGILEEEHQPIIIDNWEALGLNLDETCEIYGFIKELGDYGTRQITQREAVQQIVKEINKKINKSSTMEFTTQKKRYLDFSDCYLSNPYRHLGISGKELFSLTPEEKKQRLWLPRIFESLVANKYLFHVDYIKDTFCIQA